MDFWESGLMLEALCLIGLLSFAGVVRRLVPAVGRLGIPACIVAGIAGLVLGSSVLNVLPLDKGFLESVVYHGLAITFIALALQTPPEGSKGGVGARSIAFAVPASMALQTAIGLGIALILGTLTAERLHPGFGLMLPLGFEQGPGQALALGGAWEQGGMPDGAQVGLIVAAIGYIWAVAAGVPLAAWVRRKGLVRRRATSPKDEAGFRTVRVRKTGAGAITPLTRHVVAIALVYLATFGTVQGLAWVLAPIEQVAAMAWGFHFIIGSFLAMGARKVLRLVTEHPPLDNRSLGELAGLSVDISTTAGIAAIQIAVLQANWVPIVLVTTVGGLATLLAVLWCARRAFPADTWEHALLVFGMATGTLAVGLALVKMIDPDLESSAARSAVLGSAMAVPLTAPLVVLLIPMPAAAWPDGYPAMGWLTLGLTVLYFGLVMLGWWKIGALKLADSPGFRREGPEAA